MTLADLLPKYQTEIHRQVVEMGLPYLKCVLPAEDKFFLTVSNAIERLLPTCPVIRVMFDIDDTLVYKHDIEDGGYIRPSALALIQAASEYLSSRVQFGILSSRGYEGILAIRSYGQTEFPSHLFEAELITTRDMLPDETQREEAVIQWFHLLDPDKTNLHYFAKYDAAKLTCLAKLLAQHEQDGLVYVDDAALASILQQGVRFSSVGAYSIAMLQ